MNQWIRAMARKFGRLFYGQKPKLDGSHLLGLYFGQTNGNIRRNQGNRNNSARADRQRV
jgi:hypothetical protein